MKNFFLNTNDIVQTLNYISYEDIKNDDVPMKEVD